MSEAGVGWRGEAWSQGRRGEEEAGEGGGGRRRGLGWGEVSGCSGSWEGIWESGSVTLGERLLFHQGSELCKKKRNKTM